MPRGSAHRAGGDCLDEGSVWGRRGNTECGPLTRHSHPRPERGVLGHRHTALHAWATPRQPAQAHLIAAVLTRGGSADWGKRAHPGPCHRSHRKSSLSHCSLQTTLPTGSHEPALDLLRGSRGREDQRASTASITLMGPVSPLGRKKFHQSARRLSPAGGTRGWEGREVWNHNCGDHQPKEGVLTKKQREGKNV